jgi:hypothetical protein
MSGWRGVLRYLGYTCFIIVSAFLVLWASVRLPDSLRISVVVSPGSELTTSEFSPVEFFQCALILFCGLIFSWIAFRDRLRRPVAIGFASLFLLFLVRELDFFIDTYFADNLWQVLAAVIIAVSGVYMFRHRQRLQFGWRRSWPSAGLGILISGILILIPFAQIVATDSLWQAVLGDDYIRSAKLAAEELLELGGYLVITIGSLEFLHGWSLLPKTRMIDYRRRRRRS